MSRIVKKAIVLLSGGLDSATCCWVARDEGFEIYALSFIYGQRHGIEIEAARRVAKALGVKEHREIKLELCAGDSSLMEGGSEVPKNGHVGHKANADIPATYVPARNTIFLAHALGCAEVIGCRDIFTGVNAVDYSGYPDCRPGFIEAFQKMANLATKAGVEGRGFVIHTPLIGLSKADIIRLGVSLGVDYGITHSCYNPLPDGKACGHCDSCLIRKKGFEQAGVDDPTVYAQEL